MSKTRNKQNNIVNSIDNKPEQNNINSFSDNEKKEETSFKEKINKHHDSGYQKVIYYANWKNLISDIKKMGYGTSVKKILGIMTGFVILTLVIGFIMKLNPICYIPMLIADILIVPMLIVNVYKKTYEDNRFREVSQYIEQMLYSFQNSNKVLKSLIDIKPMFKDTPMEKVIQNCIDDIPAVGVEEALKHFERAYDCQKIQQLNKFLVEVEQVGGDHENAIQLLLQDRKLWVNRTQEYKKERNSKRITVNMAIAMSFILCIVMEKILPSEANITTNIIYHLSSAALYILDLILYYITDNFCSASILNGLKTRKDSDIKKYYNYIINYNRKTEFMKGLRMLPIGVLIAIIGLLFGDYLYVALGAIFDIFCLFKHKMMYNMRFKAIKEEIEIQFPRWLMNVALYVQSNSVQVALYKSIPTAPLVLQPELIKLNNAIRDNPTSIDPYLNFMSQFDLPDITASMKMFYSIASGTGSDVQQQVNEIIERNNTLLDKTEKINNDNNLAKMYAMFLLPQLTGGGKILIDMVLFFMIFMNTSMQI